jgi:hypothetical protein
VFCYGLGNDVTTNMNDSALVKDASEAFSADTTTPVVHKPAGFAAFLCTMHCHSNFLLVL